TKDLHTADYTQLYEFLKYNQKEVDELKAERLVKIQDPLALMENFNNPYAFPAPHQDQPSFNQNYMQQIMPNFKDITDPTTSMNMALALMAKAFKLNYSSPTNNNQRISSNPRNRQIAQPGMNMGQDRQMQMVGGNGGKQFRQYAVQNARNLTRHNDVIGNQIRCYNCRGVGHYARNYTVKPRRRDAAYIQTQLLIAQKEEAGIQLQAEEYDLMAAAADIDKIEEVNANCILMANLQQVSTSGTQTDRAPVYDSDGSAEVHENCDDNEIFNMFTQEEQYTELLEPIPESHQVPQNDNDIISKVTNVEQNGETVEQHPANFEETLEQHPANFEETRALYDSLYQNLGIEVEKVNSVNRKLKETNADLTIALAIFKNQTRCFEIRQEKYDKLERCYQQSVYQEQCLSKKINALHLSTAKFVGDFKSLAKEADESLAKHKALELEIERLLKAVVGVDNTKTRRPQPRSTTKHDRVPSTSKSSQSNNKEAEVEEHHRTLLLSKNKKHISSACNNIKIDSQDVISKVVCAMCKQCFISGNHDVSLRNYVNGKKSRGKKHKEKVSFKENQKKYQPKVTKPKKVGFLERLATPKPRKPRFLLRWSPTGRLFDQEGKIVDSSESESQSDCSNGYPDLFVVRRLGFLQAHDMKSKASHLFRLEVYGNCPLWK
nr:hypothetical protein [Tanacetum cinerariifolium]